MDKIGGAFESFTGSGGNTNQGQGQTDEQGGNEQQSSGGGGLLGGLGDKLNSAAGGGKEGEKNEDGLDKGVDFVQEKFMGHGDQSDESAVEQAKDEQISEFIRHKYKSATESDTSTQDK